MPTAETALLIARARRAFLAGRFEETLAALDAVAAAMPRNAMVQTARASALRELGRLREAAAACDAALAIAPRDAETAVSRARLAGTRGEAGAADRYRRALALRPGDPELVIGLAEALAQEGSPEGIEILAASVSQRPRFWQGQASLARLRWEAGEGRAFTRDIERALLQDPGARDLWIALVDALGAADLHDEAADAAAAGRSAVGDDPELLLLEALQSSEARQIERADRLFDRVPPGIPTRLAIEGRHRIRSGEYERAGALLEAALGESPWDIGTWALTGLLWRLTGDRRAQWLLHGPGFIASSPLALEAGEIDAIAAALRRLHTSRTYPIGQSLRGGTQTRGLLFERDEPELARLRAAIEAAVAEYWAALPPADPRHPLLRLRDRKPRVTGSWSVRLTGGGFHVSHFHPAGALSSACYLVVPVAREPREGWLELGGPPAGLDVAVEPLARIEPAPGRIVLFPSYLYHGTRPFSAGERLSVAFDVAA